MNVPGLAFVPDRTSGFHPPSLRAGAPIGQALPLILYPRERLSHLGTPALRCLLRRLARTPPCATIADSGRRASAGAPRQAIAALASAVHSAARAGFSPGGTMRHVLALDGRFVHGILAGRMWRARCGGFGLSRGPFVLHSPVGRESRPETTARSDAARSLRCSSLRCSSAPRQRRPSRDERNGVGCRG